MTRQDFDSLVRRIETRYAGRPAALKRASTAWVARGVAAIASWMSGLFVLGALSFVVGTLLEAPASLVFTSPEPRVLHLSSGTATPKRERFSTV